MSNVTPINKQRVLVEDLISDLEKTKGELRDVVVIYTRVDGTMGTMWTTMNQGDVALHSFALQAQIMDDMLGE